MITTKPWLWLPESAAHSLMPVALPIISRTFSEPTPSWNPLTWNNIHFKNRLGLAGGVDKNAEHIRDWIRLGAGFLEIGTVTPLPQTANPGKILSRSNEKSALWNKMGFPNVGLKKFKSNLQNINNLGVPLFANIGKNRNATNDEASASYSHLIQELEHLVQAFVINISSPNTEGLRELLEPNNLKKFLSGIVLNTKTKKPLLLKLSPDMSEHETLSAVDISLEQGISGFVLTNTRQNSNVYFSELSGGGVSGRPLAELSTAKLRLVKDHLVKIKASPLLVSVGGILTPDDVKKRFELGADLVEVYSALVFHGPTFFQYVAKAASKW